jgi:hypothetical protein
MMNIERVDRKRKNKMVKERSRALNREGEMPNERKITYKR